MDQDIAGQRRPGLGRTLRKVMPMLVATRILPLLVIGSLLLGCGVMADRALLDGLDGLLFSLMFSEDTEYAPRYSDGAFKAVHPGTSTDRVRELLGEPLERVSRGEPWETWRYSRSPSDSHYRVRAIQVAEGRVIAVFHEFYVD